MNRHRLHGEFMCISNLLKRKAETSEARAKVDRVTNMHGFIIGFLAKNRQRDIFQKDIEEEFSYRRSTASAVVGLMEEKGLITRESVPGDARLKKLVLTEKALNYVEKIDADISKTEELMKSGIDEDELKVFYGVMEKIRQNLENHLSNTGKEEEKNK